MKQDWIDFLLRQGASAEVRDFGNLSDELARTQSATILSPLLDLALIRANGEDAAEFLHNMLTNDIKSLATDSVQRNGFCNPKGRLLANFLVWHEGSDLMIALSADLHAPILKKLSMYVLRAKVKLTDASNEQVLIGLSGPQAESILAELGPIPAGALKTVSVDHGRLIRLDEKRFLLSLDSSAAPDIWKRLAVAAHPVGLACWHWLEICAGSPLVTAPNSEEFIPQMVNLDLIGGVSFSKGCYPGQEIVARTKNLGKLKRRMYRTHLDTDQAISGDHLYAPETGDQSCGRVVNVAPSPLGGNDLLAVIQSTCAEAGEVHLGRTDGPHLVLLPLPYSL